MKEQLRPRQFVEIQFDRKEGPKIILADNLAESAKRARNRMRVGGEKKESFRGNGIRSSSNTEYYHTGKIYLNLSQIRFLGENRYINREDE